MADNDLDINLNSNIPDISKSVKELITSLNKLNSSLGTNTRSSKQFKESNDLLEKSLEDTDEKVSRVDVSLTKLNNISNFVNKNFNSLSSTYKNAFAAISPLNLGTIGLSLSMSGLTTAAFNEIRAMDSLGDSLTYLSSDTGSVSGAMNLLFEASRDSTLSVSSMQSVLKGLVDQGIQSRDTLKGLSKTIGDLYSATGIAATQWQSFTGELSYRYGLPLQSIRNIGSGLIATGLRANQLEKAMGTVNKVLDMTAFISGKKNPAAMEQTTKAIGSAIKAFDALGISAEKSGQFIEQILDPDKFEQNAYLFARMGISAQEFSENMLNADGRTKLLQKTMKGLPALSKQLKEAGKNNFFAFRELSKTLGVPMELISKMADSTEAQIEELMKAEAAKQEGEKALKKKQEQQKQEAAKFQDMIDTLRRQGLAPLMNFITNNMGSIISLLQRFSKSFADVLGYLTKEGGPAQEFFREMIDFTTKSLIPAFKSFYTTMIDIGSIFMSIYKFFKPLLSFLGGPGSDSQESTAEGVGKTAAIFTAVSGSVLLISKLIGTFREGMGLFSTGRRKTVSNAKVGELADAIGESVAKYGEGGGPSQMGLGGGGIASKALMTIAAMYAAYKVGGVVGGAGSKRAETVTGLGAAYYTGKSMINPESLYFLKEGFKEGRATGGIKGGIKGASEFLPDLFKGNTKNVLTELKGLSKVKGGGVQAIIADITAGFAAENIAKMGGLSDDRATAAKNLASYGASTGVSLLGGPVSAAINAAMIGAFRAIDVQDEIMKTVETPFKRVGDNANFLDKIANTIQAGAGGALQLGIGYAIDDLVMLTTGKKTEIGNAMSSMIGSVFLPIQVLSISLRSTARVYDKFAEGFKTSSKIYSTELGLLNDKISLAGKSLNENIRKGNYFEALSDFGSLIKLKFNEYVTFPLKNVLRSLWFGLLELVKKFESYIPKSFRIFGAEETLSALKREANLSSEVNKVFEDIRTSGKATGLQISDLQAKSIYAQNQGWTDISKQIQEFFETQNKKQEIANKNLAKDMGDKVKDGAYGGTKKAGEEQRNAENQKPAATEDSFNQRLKILIENGLLTSGTAFAQ